MSKSFDKAECSSEQATRKQCFCLLIRQFFVIFVKMKTADGTFGYGHCRDMEDSYSAWKQAEIDIHIIRSLNVLE